MKKIAATTIGILSFFALFISLSNYCVRPNKLTLALNLNVPQNDKIEVRYRQVNTDNSTEITVTEKYLSGSEKPQTIEATIPLNKGIAAITIAISNNSNQKTITVNSAQLKTNNRHQNLHKLSQKWFTTNAWVTSNNGTLTTAQVDGGYNPLLTSTSYLHKTVKYLTEPQPKFGTAAAASLALIVALVLGFSFFFIDIKLLPKTAFTNGFMACFFIMLLVPSLASVCDYDPCEKNYEKRQKAPRPSFAISEDFPAAFESYYNDNFGLRNAMVTWLYRIKVSLFNCSPKPDIVQFGHNQYLFYNGYDSYCHANLLPPNELSQLHDTIVARQGQLNRSGITYICGFWPTKHTIYPEQMPFSMASQVAHNKSVAEQIKESFRNDNLLFFDVKTDMLEAKKEKQLYQKFDTHWNDNGAYIAYKSFCQQTYPILKLTPVPIDSFNLAYNACRCGNLITLLSTDSIFGYTDSLPCFTPKTEHITITNKFSQNLPQNTVVTYNNDCLNRKKVVIFRDSYTTALIKFLSQHFYEVTYIWDRYDRLYIEELKPDIVISCPVEQYIKAI